MQLYTEFYEIYTRSIHWIYVGKYFYHLKWIFKVLNLKEMWMSDNRGYGELK